MLSIYKNKGVTLIELMVAMSLGLLLVFSMLVFYSTTQQNQATHLVANKKQQELRKMIHLISRNIENTGAFECAQKSDIFRDIGNINLGDNNSGLKINRTGIKRFPKEIISLGAFTQKERDRQQFIFVHPISQEHLDRGLGLMDIQERGTGASLNTTAHYSPVEIRANCGIEESTIYIGSTIIETVPINATKRPPITQFKPTIAEADTAAAKDIDALMVMSALQPRLQIISKPVSDPQGITPKEQFIEYLTTGYERSYFLKRIRKIASDDKIYSPGAGSDFHQTFSSSDEIGKDLFTSSYLPSIYDGTVVFLSDNNTDTANPNDNLPFGKNEVVISLGFATSEFSSSVPDRDIIGTSFTTDTDRKSQLEKGGWLAPYDSQDNYNLIINTELLDGTDPNNKNSDSQLINRVLHPKTDTVGYNMRTYPILPDAAQLVRAVKFTFTLNKGTDQQQIVTRVVRFRNIFLKRLEDD